MPDEFWFEVSTTVDVFGADGTTVIGRLQTDTPYRAIDANEHWLAIPGPSGNRGFVAIDDLDYREVAAPGETTAADDADAAAEPAAGATEEPAGNATVEHADAEALVATTTEHSNGTGRGMSAEPADDDGARLAEESGDDGDTSAGAHDTSAYLHATSGEVEEMTDDPATTRRRQLLIAAGGVLGIIALLFVISTFTGDSAPPTTVAAATSTTTSTTTTTTTTTPPAVSTTVPAVGSTPASATAPRNWRIVFFNDFTTSRDAAFPVGEITANADATIVDGAYVVDIEAQRSMETLLQTDLTSRFAYFGATVGETRLEAGAHVCGLLFSTNEALYVVTVNAEVASGPREFAIVDGNGNEVLPVTGSTVVQPGENHVAVLVRAPQYKLFINGEEVANGKIEGNQFTGFGLTYGATSSGQCSFDDLEVWRPPIQTDATGDDADAADTPPEG